MRASYLVALAPLLAANAFEIAQPQHICVSACVDFSSYLLWNSTTDYALLDYYTAACTNPLRLQSVYWCAQKYCSPGEIYAGLALQNRTCSAEAGVALPKFEELATSRRTLKNATTLSYTEYLSAPYALDAPAIPDEDWFTASFRTDQAYDRNFWYSYDFTWATYGFWGLVFLISMINHTVSLVRGYIQRPATQRTRSGGVWTWIRRQLILPPTFKKHCQEPIGWATLSPRLESLIIVTYLVLSCVFCFPGYDLFTGNLYWPDIAPQLTRYIADRTAVLSIAQVPLIWLFAARNDPLLWLTSFSFAAFNRFHRWVARMSFILALVHSIAWTYDYIKFYGVEEYNEAYQLTWWWTGVVATIVMALLLPASVYWLRNKHYDFFLLTHILLSLVFLITLYYHIQIYEGLFDGFIWPCVAIWALERVLRIARIIYASVLPRLIKGTKAVATYDASSDMIRLDVTAFFGDKGVAPGQYYYVYLPASLKGWESHPFTLCSWDSNITSTPSSPQSGRGSMDIEKAPGVSSQAVVQQTTADIKHTFLVRPHAGFTERLRNKITGSDSKQGQGEVTVLLEGPYGHKLDLSRHSDVLIVAAGSGIVTAISHAYHLLGNNHTEVHLTWVTPQRKLVYDICENELAAVLHNPRFHLTAYVTGKNGDDVEESVKLAADTIRSGRPDIFAVMQETREKCKFDLGIINSGTPQVADACRAGVVRLLKEPGPKVECYAEDTPW